MSAGQHPDAARFQSMWSRYERAPESQKKIAQRRTSALQRVAQLVRSGSSLTEARSVTCIELRDAGVRGASNASLARWAAAVHGYEEQHWLALLLPNYVGRASLAKIPQEAWDIFKADYLRLERPAAAACYERLQRIAHSRGWKLPRLVTFKRRLVREIPREVLVLARDGSRALDRMFPSQQRDRSVFTALQGVNADGHKFDVFAQSEQGKLFRPVMVAVQDLYSGKLLSWRVGESESSELVRLAFRDLVERYGIPEAAWFDNGRGFASKLLTGGAQHRFRFKASQDDPVGVLVGLGIQIHWTSPYHGQAKPIERAFRDLCDRVAKHPALAGAYTGNRPDAKPENHGSRAIPLERFRKILNVEIAAHNARVGRRSSGMKGRSFDQVFEESYGSNPIRRATAEQIRHLLQASDLVTVNKLDSSIRLLGNRYWHEALVESAGQKVLVRFDPDNAHAPVHVYGRQGEFICDAGCIMPVGFNDTLAAKQHAQAKRDFRRATRKVLDAERRMDAADVADLLPHETEEVLPVAKVVAPIFGRGRPASGAAPAPSAQGTGREERFQQFMLDLQAGALRRDGGKP